MTRPTLQQYNRSTNLAIAMLVMTVVVSWFANVLGAYGL